MKNEYVLEMKHISKGFTGVQALDDVSLNVRKGTVHALMGENGAGKSTLMKCLFGIYSPDAGEILLEGQKVTIQNPKQALDLGVSMIQQELHPILHRNVMENIWLGRYPTIGWGPFRFIDEKKMERDTIALLKKLKIDLNIKTWTVELSASQCQSMEIAIAVSYNSKIIVMDEPTSSLTDNEVNRLFEIINQLRDSGVSIIYISHKMEEILKISDDITIMRDGKYIGTYLASEIKIDEIISKMVGRDVGGRYPKHEEHQNKDQPILEVKNLTSGEYHSFRDISFDLKKGEILGIGGLVGAKRTELVESLFGMRPVASGEVFVHGQKVSIKSPIDAKSYGIALLTEERRATGIFPSLSIKDNTISANLRSYVNSFGLIRNKKVNEDVAQSIEALRVKTPNAETPIQNLSGGNQQKVLLARWLLTNPEILILDEPTRGIDIGAKYEIYLLMAELVKKGKSIIMISSELPELIGMSHRIAVMCEGQLTGIINQEDADPKEIMRLATKFDSPEKTDTAN